MKIGIFDSGIGGLTILREIIKILPEYNYLYLADSKNLPYGEKSSEEIYECVRRGLGWLFSKDVKLTIIACNTASSEALRRIQREWLPKSEWSDRKALGVLIPLAEEVSERSKGFISAAALSSIARVLWRKNTDQLAGRRFIGVIATTNTVKSGTYIKELQKINPNAQIFQVAAPLLAPLIEDNASEEKIKEALKMYLSPLKLANIQSLILGCTHYPIFLSEIREIMGDKVFIPNPGEIVAKKLRAYLARHPEIEKELSKDGKQEFFTTGDPQQFQRLSLRFFGESLRAKGSSF